MIKSKIKVYYKKRNNGFTLIEILVVIGIIAVLAAVVLVAVNPSRQFKLARDAQRVSNVTAILNAVGQNLAEHKGLLICGTSTVSIPATSSVMTNDPQVITRFDMADCIVPNYISSLPFDPTYTGAGFISGGSYNTGYSIYQDSNGRISVGAVGEITSAISVTR